jgi:hypothetical protein
VSKWLLFNANSAIFQLYHGENKLIVNDIMMRSTLYLTNTLSWIFLVLTHWNNSPLIDMLPHSDTLSWFQANQSLLFFLNTACLAEKQQIPILQSLVSPDQGSKPTIYHTRGEYANHYTTDAANSKWHPSPLSVIKINRSIILMKYNNELTILETQCIAIWKSIFVY